MDENINAVSIFNKHAGLYQEKYMNVDLYGDTFDSFCSLLKEKNKSVLEIACGPGNITKYILGKRPDLKITGVDLAPNMIELARKNNPTAEFLVMDARRINELNKKFDAVVCGFCLPYLSLRETTKLMNDVAYLLNPGGVFYLSTIEDDYNKSEYVKGSTGDEVFMHYYNENLLKKILSENGFEICEMKRKGYFMNETIPVVDIIFIARLKKAP